jgi:hypothetical protein
MSDYLSFAGAHVMTLSLTMSLWGAWVADIVLSTSEPLPSVADSLAVGDLTLIGTVFRAASFAGARSARLIGGFGGWPKSVSAQDYRGSSVMASTVLRDAATAVGEKIVMGTTDTNLFRFTREAAAAQRVLKSIAGASWWVAPDGVTHIGPRPSATVKGEFVVVAWSGKTGKFEIATETLSEWLPGNTFTGPGDGVQTISSLMIESSNTGKLRMMVLAL